MTFRRAVLCFGLLFLMTCASQPRRVTDTSCGVATEAPQLAIYFVVDRDCDADWIVGMFQQDDPAGLESRARSMGIDQQLAKRIRAEGNFYDAKKLALAIVDAQFEKYNTDINAARSEFQSQWRELIGPFSKVVVDVTQSDWVHPNYFCVVSSIHPGISDWFGNRVGIRFDSGSEFKRRILAHELALSDVFQLLRKRHDIAEISDWQVWAFSEITAVLILDDPRLKPFWPDFLRAGEYFSHSNYPQLSGLEAQLKAIYDDRSSYSDYQERAVLILRDFHQTHQ